MAEPMANAGILSFAAYIPRAYHDADFIASQCDTPAEIIEIIAPSGFEDYFREVAAAWGDAAAFGAINQKYALDMKFESVPELCGRFGLTFPAL